jgi:hypothetical protein
MEGEHRDMDEPQPVIAGNGLNGRPRSLLDLGLRGPTLGVLQRQGVLAVDQLVNMSPDDLMSLRRVGLSRMLEVRRALQSHGLDLQMAVERVPERSWALEQRVSLVCCEQGECSLELRTSGADASDTEAIIRVFVEAHRQCEKLVGHAPLAGRVETSRTEV